MPITDFQLQILAELAHSRTNDRYLAGGAALHFAANSIRHSDDLDFFHDSVERVASTFEADRAQLDRAGYDVDVTLSQPGFVRAIVRRGTDATRIDWAHDSAWRFMPLQRDPLGGLLLHQVDLAANKILALAGRDEPRDYVDTLFVHANVLPLAGLVWAAVGKDPGFTPLSLLELLRRRGKHRPEDIARLQLTEPFDATGAKQMWLQALEAAERFARTRPPEELGCLYFATAEQRLVIPRSDADLESQELVTHFGSPSSVLPQVADRAA